MSGDVRVLEGQWALVTGGSKGIGRGIAEQLVAAGASVVLVARDPLALEAAVQQLRAGCSPSQQVIAMPADTSDRDSLDALFTRLRDELPRLNIAVANAGTGAITPFLELSMQDWDDVVALNLTGSFQCIQLAGRLMRDRPSDNMAIVVVSSIRALGALPGRSVYSATKAGLNQLARVAAVELAPLGIRVNLLSPGITATPLSLERNPEVYEAMVENVPMARAGSPADMAAAALYLCSPASSFVTGTNLIVDGGESLG
ncbi:MAG: 3-oxoacyl-ACP reductase [Frankiales bacterium]|nr:3-oxoacyl-ACP reductase [Frankiales bacterium]